MNMFIKSSRHYFREILGGFPLALPFMRLIDSTLKGQSKDKFITRHHDICIEGPPRSANTYSTNVFRFWNPDCQIAHHVHLPFQIILASRWSIPCLVLLREPKDATASLCVAHNLSIGIVLLSYIHFYDRIRKIRPDVVVGKFEDVINNPQILANRLNQKFNSSFESSLITPQDRERIFDNITNNIKRKNKLMLPLPNPEKETLKKEIEGKIIIHPLYNRAKTKYEEWLIFSELQENFDE